MTSKKWKFSEVCVVTTTACQFHCPDCIAKYALPDRKGYTTYANMRDFVSRCKVQGAHFQSVTFTGGEPTLNHDLVDMIQLGKYVSDSVHVLTNGYQAQTDQYGEADRISISHYGGQNLYDIMRLKKSLGNRVRVQNVVHLPSHTGLSSEKVKCNARQLILFKDRVYPCAASWRLCNNGVDLNEDFISILEDNDTTSMKLCHTCINNQYVRTQLRFKPTIEMRVLETSLTWHIPFSPIKTALYKLYRRLR
jgi:MoaA/NifB/PqqE/SkfB family radical SAM enzyme